MSAVSADKQSVSRTPRGTWNSETPVDSYNSRTLSHLFILFFFFAKWSVSRPESYCGSSLPVLFNFNFLERKKKQRSQRGSGAADPSATKEGLRVKMDEERDGIRDEPEGNGSAGRRLVYHFLLQVDAPQVSR